MHEQVNTVHRTKDYRIFNIISQNREINRAHVERLKKSMAAKLMPSVVIVNKDMEVIDGQHNLAARKSLGLHVDYMICPDLTANDIPSFNVERVNWNATDYM